MSIRKLAFDDTPAGRLAWRQERRKHITATDTAPAEVAPFAPALVPKPLRLHAASPALK
jgi:hypothetical protein